MHALRLLVTKQLTAAWRYRWFAVLFTWLICAVGWAYVLSIPNQYLASARLFVDSEAVLTPLLRGLAADNGQGRQLDFLQRTLLSRPNLEKLISKTDLELSLRGPADRELLVQGLANSIRITPQTRNLFTISYRSESPRLAFEVVRTMLTTFVESKTGNNRTDLENAGKFFQDQIAQYERQLRDAERRRAEFRTKYIDLLPGDGGISRLEQAQGTVRSLQGQLVDALAKRETLSKELANTPQLVVTETEGGGFGGGGGGRLRDAERQLQELRLRYTDQHPDVIAMCHAHTTYGSAWCTTGRPLDMISQDAACLYNNHAVVGASAGAVAVEKESGTSVAQEIGKSRAILHQNHGLLTTSRHSIDDAAFWFIALERCCQVQLLVEASGVKPQTVSQKTAEYSREHVGNDFIGWLHFQTLYDQIAATQPDMFD